MEKMVLRFRSNIIHPSTKYNNKIIDLHWQDSNYITTNVYMRSTKLCFDEKG